MIGGIVLLGRFVDTDRFYEFNNIFWSFEKLFAVVEISIFDKPYVEALGLQLSKIDAFLELDT